MSEDLKNQLFYLRSVLGLGSFLAPSLSLPSVPSPRWQVRGNRASELAFVYSRSPSLGHLPASSTLQDLLERMIKALGRGPSDVLIIDVPKEGGSKLQNIDRKELVELLSEVAFRRIVCLGEDAAQLFLSPTDSFVTGLLVEKSSLRVLLTHSLQSLESSPALKRETWQHLQALEQLAKI